MFSMHKHLHDPEGGVETKPERRGFKRPPRGLADFSVSENHV